MILLILSWKKFLHYKEIQRLFPELYCMFYNHANKAEKITVKISPQNKKFVV